MKYHLPSWVATTTMAAAIALGGMSGSSAALAEGDENPHGTVTFTAVWMDGAGGPAPTHIMFLDPHTWQWNGNHIRADESGGAHSWVNQGQLDSHKAKKFTELLNNPNLAAMENRDFPSCTGAYRDVVIATHLLTVSAQLCDTLPNSDVQPLQDIYDFIDKDIEFFVE